MPTRPNSDLATAGWIPSAALPVYDMINEAVASDLDYVSSPALGSGAPVIMGLDASLPAGSYYINIRARVTSATGYLRIKLLNATNVVQGTSIWQATTDTFGSYSIPIDIVAICTRVQIEVSSTNIVVLPTILSRTINSTGTAITLVFSEAVYTNINTGFTLTMAGGVSTMTYSSGAGTTTLVYNLSRVINSGESGTLAYTQPGNGIEAISTRFDLASFSNSSIINSSTVGAGGGPVPNSPTIAYITGSGSTFTVSWDPPNTLSDGSTMINDPLTIYTIYWGTVWGQQQNGGSFNGGSANVNVPTLTYTGGSSGTWWVAISASNSYGESWSSPEVQITV